MKDEKKTGILVLFFLLTIMIIIIYWEFLSGKYLFFVNSVDTTTNFLPNLINLHDVFYNGEFPMWSFSKGLGANVTVGNPNYLGDMFSWILILLPREIIPYAFGWVHAFKIIIAGLFFYLYLCQFKSLSMNQRILGALLYSFNGHMLSRGQWGHYATEVAMVAPWLIGLEMWYNARNRFLYPVTFSLLLISRSASYVYIYSLLSFSYIILRFVFDNGLRLKQLMKRIIGFFPVYILGLGLGAILLLPGIINIISSGRIDLGQTGFDWGKLTNGLRFEVAQKNIATFLKTFAPNITGIFETNTGNVLEDTCFYGGILSIVFIPTLIKNEIVVIRKKWILFFVLLLGILYGGTIWPKSFLNAFMLSSVKTSSLWVNIVMIMVGLYSISHYDSKHIKLLTLNSIFILSFLYFGLTNNILIQEMKYEMLLVVGLWIIYLFLLRDGKNWSYKLEQKILLVCCIELVLFARISITFVSEFPIYTQDDYNNYYEEYSELEKLEKDEFYRIAREKNSYYYHNLAMRYNYFGLTEYDSILPKLVLEVKDFFKLETPNDNIFYGIEELPGLSSILSTKYLVSDGKELGENYKNYNYFCDLNSKNQIYLNEQFHPFGFTYNYMAKADKIKNLPIEVKDSLIENAVILNSKDYGRTKLPEWEYRLEEYEANDEQIENQENIILNIHNNFYNYECLNDSPSITFKMPILNAGVQYIEFELESAFKQQGKFFFALENGKFGKEYSTLIDIKPGNNKYQIVLEEDTKFVKISIGKKGETVIIKNVMWKSYFDNNISNKKFENHLKISMFTNNRIEGEIYSLSDEIMFLSIPYDRGWTIKINGEKRDILKTNAGFMGVELLDGKNNIEIIYLTPGLYLGVIITVVSTLLYLVYMLYYKKKYFS